MRIAMVGPFGFRPKMTMRARALSLARALVARGHTVALFMPPWHTPEDADRTWQEDGVTLRYVPLRGGIPAVTRRLVRETVAWQPDVVHCFKPKAYSGLVAWWLWQTRRRRLRIVVDSDDWEGAGGWNDLDPYSPLQKQFFAWQEQWGMTHCHALTVASRALQTLAWGHGVPRGRVVYLPNGWGIPVPAALPGPPDDPPTVLLYTRFFEFDVARLVAVLAGARAALPGLRVLLVGGGLHAADSAAFRAQMTARGLWSCVEDAGWLAEEAVAPALARAHVGLYLMDDTLLNRTKCPVKLADMAALGLPVVGEAVGQVSEYVVHGHTGRLVASGDVDGLTAALVALLGDAEERRRCGTAARAHVRDRFAWERAADSAELAYNSPSRRSPQVVTAKGDSG